jgi:YD repeat-containing protein
MDYKRGLPTEITMFNGTKKVKQTIFDYEEKIANNYKAKGYAEEICFKRTQSTPEFCEQDRGNYGEDPCFSYTQVFIYSSIFETRSAWYLKNKETERIFDINDDTKFVETSTLFRYENPSHAQLTSTEMKRSDGTTLVTQLKYPLDYTVTSGTLFQMRQNATFIHSAVVEKIQTVFPVSGSSATPKTINGIYSTFNSSFLPETISVLEISQPTTTLYPKAPALPSASDYVKKQTVNYDGYGNVLEIIPVNGFPTAYLYSYGNKLLIAEVKNMTYSGLTTLMNNAPQVIINDSNEGTLRTTLATLRSRLPANTLMTSFTHNTAYGVTSKIEPNGITSYFGYDTLGRLSFIKDNNQNIVKSYQYNFKNQ